MEGRGKTGRIGEDAIGGEGGKDSRVKRGGEEMGPVNVLIPAHGGGSVQTDQVGPTSAPPATFPVFPVSLGNQYIYIIYFIYLFYPPAIPRHLAHRSMPMLPSPPQVSPQSKQTTEYTPDCVHISPNHSHPRSLTSGTIMPVVPFQTHASPTSSSSTRAHTLPSSRKNKASPFQFPDGSRTEAQVR